MYSKHNEGKSVIAERFIRILQNNIYKYMSSKSKNVYIDKLDKIVSKCNNTHHRTIKMKPFNVKPRMYIDLNIRNNKEKPYISEYKIIFAKGYIPNWSEEVFLIKKSWNKTVPWTYVISGLKKLLEHFTKKSYKKHNKRKLGQKN